MSGTQFDPNTPSSNLYDMDARTYDQIIVDEIFYKTNNPRDEVSYRKLDEQTALNIKTRQQESIPSRTTVYVKN